MSRMNKRSRPEVEEAIEAAMWRGPGWPPGDEVACILEQHHIEEFEEGYPEGRVGPMPPGTLFLMGKVGYGNGTYMPKLEGWKDDNHPLLSYKTSSGKWNYNGTPIVMRLYALRAAVKSRPRREPVKLVLVQELSQRAKTKRTKVHHSPLASSPPVPLSPPSGPSSPLASPLPMPSPPPFVPSPELSPVASPLSLQLSPDPVAYTFEPSSPPSTVPPSATFVISLRDSLIDVGALLPITSSGASYIEAADPFSLLPPPPSPSFEISHLVPDCQFETSLDCLLEETRGFEALLAQELSSPYMSHQAYNPASPSCDTASEPYDSETYHAQS